MNNRYLKYLLLVLFVILVGLLTVLIIDSGVISISRLVTYKNSSSVSNIKYNPSSDLVHKLEEMNVINNQAVKNLTISVVDKVNPSYLQAIQETTDGELVYAAAYNLRDDGVLDIQLQLGEYVLENDMQNGSKWLNAAFNHIIRIISKTNSVGREIDNIKFELFN